MSAKRNEFLDHSLSEESDLDDGYDSEAAELSKSARATTSGRGAKRRKLSHSDNEEVEPASGTKDPRFNTDAFSDEEGIHAQHVGQLKEDDIREDGLKNASRSPTQQTTSLEEGTTDPQSNSKKKKPKDKETKPGVIYLSSVPPYLKPSALRNLLSHRGFSPITRLFLTPASKAKSTSTSKKNSRQLYTEGWIEFASKKTARRCAESLNAQIIGGRKGGFYHDDLWNMKYLRGMGWSELMAGIREERREEEGRRDEERRQIAKETKRFIEGVEEGRRIEGIKRKRSEKKKDGDNAAAAGMGGDGGADTKKRTWRQFEVKDKRNDGLGSRNQNNFSEDAKEVLGKIF